MIELGARNIGVQAAPSKSYIACTGPWRLHWRASALRSMGTDLDAQEVKEDLLDEVFLLVDVDVLVLEDEKAATDALDQVLEKILCRSTRVEQAQADPDLRKVVASVLDYPVQCAKELSTLRNAGVRLRTTRSLQVELLSPSG